MQEFVPVCGSTTRQAPVGAPAAATWLALPCSDVSHARSEVGSAVAKRSFAPLVAFCRRVPLLFFPACVLPERRFPGICHLLQVDHFVVGEN